MQNLGSASVFNVNISSVCLGQKKKEPKLQIRETFTAASKNKMARYSLNFGYKLQMMVGIGK